VPEQSKSGQTEIESLKVKLNDHEIHYLKGGSGPPVVLLHGGASDSNDWIQTINGLADRYSFYAPDLIGFGQSTRYKEGYYLSDFSDFALEFIDKLQLKDVVLVGHSFGARICVDITLQRPDNVRKLVLVDAAGLGKVSRYGNVIMTIAWAIRKVLQKRQPYPQFLAKEGEDNDWLCVNELPKLRTPTLIIWKRHDPYLSLSLAHRAEKQIAGSKLAVLPGYGHAPHQQNSEAFNRLLVEFIDS
jgi:pimeloyl-ACP methyl ester carboxylesterase